MVFGNKGDRSATGVCFSRNPSTGEARLFGEYLPQRAGRGRRRRDPHAGADRPHGRRCSPTRSASSRRTCAASRSTTATCRTSSSPSRRGTCTSCRRAPGSAPRRPRCRCAVDMVDEGLISREEAVARIDPAQLDQLLHPMIDPKADVEVAAHGLNASPGAASGAIVLDADTRRRARKGGRVRDPRPLGDDARRHPRADRGGGRADRARRHDLARGGRRARDGQAVRRRLRRALDRRRGEDGRHRRPRTAGGRHDHDRRRHRHRDRRRRRPRAAAAERGLRDRARLGRRHPPAPGVGERRHAGGRRARARVRRTGHRPLPDGAHVHGRGAAARRPRDDPRRRRERPAAQRSNGCCRCSSRTSRGSSRRWPGSPS